MNLLARAERDVLLRALVAAALIVGILVLGAASASAEPGCNYASDGSCLGNITHKATRTGAGRPAGCPRLWCGCWARLQVGIKDPAYNRALHWLTLPRTTKQVGAWAVMRRKGGGHVGRVVAVDASGNPVIVSGNHNGRVATATYPRSRVLAYVRP